MVITELTGVRTGSMGQWERATRSFCCGLVAVSFVAALIVADAA